MSKEHIVESFSWIWWKNKNIAIKRFDKSLIKGGESGIPVEIRDFFDTTISNLKINKDIKIMFNKKIYKVSYYFGGKKNPRSKITLCKTLHKEIIRSLRTSKDDIVCKILQHYELPCLRFHKKNYNNSEVYELQVIDYKDYNNLDNLVFRYNLKLYGNNCIICGIDSYKKYGDLDSNCIIYYYDKESNSNIPVCYNCKYILENNNINLDIENRH